MIFTARDKDGDLGEMPIGFTMALLQNGPAMTAYAGLDEAARAEIIAKAKMAKSKQDMRDIVGNIAGESHLI